MSQAFAPLFLVDAFTDRAFAGNQAAIVLLDGPVPADWMQSLAKEMNLSETAFVQPPDDQGVRNLRWFTPALEVSLCGHATLAAAHVLFEQGLVDDVARFDSLGGPLAVRRSAGGLTMDFPDLSVSDWQPTESALRALGIGPGALTGSGISRHDPEDWYALLEVESADVVRAVRPDFPALHAERPGGWLVTASADEQEADEIDFVSRFFAPKMGVDEDPVTGSAHCCLVPWWCDRLGRDQVVGRQISERSGIVHGVRRGGRVHLTGRAVTVLRGELLVPPAS